MKSVRVTLTLTVELDHLDADEVPTDAEVREATTRLIDAVRLDRLAHKLSWTDTLEDISEIAVGA